MNYAAFIFARGGSKALPGKNIKLFNGKPLIAWSIEHSLKVSRLNKVSVSTDSLEIADISLSYGAEIPFMRPQELAQDSSAELLSWRHAIKHFKEAKGYYPDALVSIPATAPLRIVEDIENCLNVYEEGDVDAVITVTEAHRNPYFNMVKMNNAGSMEVFSNPPQLIHRRQDAPTVYDVTTVCYVASVELILNANSIYERNVKSVLIPKERAIDIDTIYDFELAEYLAKNKINKYEGERLK